MEPHLEKVSVDATHDPPSFTDTEGRVWRVALNYGLAKRIREGATGVDLLDVQTGGVFTQIAAEPLLVIDILWALCEQQAEKTHKCTSDDFLEAIDGDVLEKAVLALEAAIVGFSPPSVRPHVEAMLGKVHKIQDQANEARVDAINDEEVDKSILSALGRQKDQAVKQISETLAKEGTLKT